MMCLVVKVFFVAAICSGFTNSQGTCPADRDETWSYDRSLPNGPQNWGNLPNNPYPMCNGRMQSPVNINTSDVEYQRFTRLQLKNYDKPITIAKIENDGHTVKVSPDDKVQRSVSINGSSYDLTQFHFHWGRTRENGSEHTVNGKYNSMELHLVHENSAGEVAVIGVFIEEGKSYGNNKGLKPIVQSLESIPYKNDKTELKRKIDLRDLVDKKCSFFRYQGSLTTPPCTEGVIWSICKQSISISKNQMAEFRKLYSAKENSQNISECRIAGNFRPIQPLNGRQIVFSPRRFF